MTTSLRTDPARLIIVGDILSTGEVAQMLGKSSTTVTRDVIKGRLPYLLKLPGAKGAYIFDRSDIESAAKGVAA